ERRFPKTVRSFHQRIKPSLLIVGREIKSAGPALTVLVLPFVNPRLTQLDFSELRIWIPNHSRTLRVGSHQHRRLIEPLFYKDLQTVSATLVDAFSAPRYLPIPFARAPVFRGPLRSVTIRGIDFYQVSVPRRKSRGKDVVVALFKLDSPFFVPS